MNNLELKLKNIGKYTIINIEIDYYKNELCEYNQEIIYNTSKEVESRINNYNTTKNKTICKINENKYLVIIHEILSEYEIIYEVKKIIQEIVKTHYTYKDKCIFIDVTIGVSTSEYLYTLEKSEKALYDAKVDGYSYKIYKSEENKNVINWAKVINYAINNKGIQVLYQPLVDNVTNNIICYEALVRMKDTNNKIYTPDKFIEESKKLKIYTKITKVIVDNVLKTIENTGSSVNINITYEDMVDYKTKNYIIETLKYRKDIAKNVNFEITETENIEDYKAVKEFIQEVKGLGSLIFIDDFGTGYSNFEKILELDIDVIKIDGSIIKKIMNKKYKHLIKTIVDLGKNLNIKIVAEHVETREIQEEVKKMGIEMSQGYFIGKPTEKIITNKITI